MNDSNNNIFSYPFVKVLLGVIAIIIITFIVHFLTHDILKLSSKPTPTNSTATVSSQTKPSGASSSYAVLSPATVPSKTPECSQQLSYASNGSPSPIQCANGYLNVLVWKALSAIEPQVMTLGYSATVSQVQTAICNDANAADEDSKASQSNAVEQSVYQISALYYGWSFSSDPTIVLRNGTC